MLALLAAPASQAQNHTFLVTDAGIGRLNGDTTYAVKDVSAALGGMTVTESKIYYEDIPIPVLEATRDGKRMLLAFKREGGLHISRAITYAPEAVTSTGVSVGMPMAKVFHHLPDQRCRNGLEQEKGRVFCPAPDLENVRLMFRCDYATRDDSLPPANVLVRCPVEAIIWISNE
ncbi:MAG TPA: DUF1131 family protein [Reyranella sp.]|jgi:hypothetical protein